MKARLWGRDFTLLWLGQMVSHLGNGAGVIATMWWVQSNNGSALALGVLAATKTMVAVLLSPFAGVVVDRLNRKRVIVSTDVLRGLVYLVFAYHAYQGSLTMSILCIGSIINSACAQFFSPAIGASIPLVVPGEKLQQANSLRKITDQTSSTISYALGGVLIAVLGIPGLLLADGCSFLLSAVSEAFIVIPQVTTSAGLTTKVFFDDLKAGIDFARSDLVLFRLLTVVVSMSFCFVPFTLLLPMLVTEHLGADSTAFGYITSAQMAGMLLGALLIFTAKAQRCQLWLMKWGIAIQATAFAVSPLVPGKLWAALLPIYGLSGFVNSCVNITFLTAVQRNTPQEYMGKMLSLVNAMVAGAQPLASALGGYLADSLGLVTVFAGCAVLGIATNLYFLAIPGVMSYFGVEKRTAGAMAVSH